MKNNFNLPDLTNRIDLLRNKMIETGNKEGLRSPETIFHSQELDKLIYAYQMLRNSYRGPSKGR